MRTLPVKELLELGSYAVVVGSAITRPKDITRKFISRRPSGLRKTTLEPNSLAHITTWLRSDFN